MRLSIYVLICICKHFIVEVVWGQHTQVLGKNMRVMQRSAPGKAAEGCMLISLHLVGKRMARWESAWTISEQPGTEATKPGLSVIDCNSCGIIISVYYFCLG